MTEISSVIYGPPSSRERETIESLLSTIVLSRKMFPEQSVGSTLFPKLLGGKSRPYHQFEVPLIDVTTSQPGRFLVYPLLSGDQISALDPDGSTSLLTLLSSHERRLPPPDTQLGKEIRRRLTNFLSYTLGVGPEGFLVAQAFNTQRLPLPATLEDERKKLLLTALDRLKQPRRAILMLRYGILDGILRTLYEVSNFFDKSLSYLEATEEIALRDLKRVYHREPRFLSLVPFPKSSFPAILGANYLFELQRIFPSVDFKRSTLDGLLTRANIKQLRFRENMPLLEFLRFIKPELLPIQTRAEILDTLRKIKESGERNVRVEGSETRV